MIRAIIQSVFEGVIKRLTASGRSDEIIENREYFQHYGFTSRPLSGAEAILIQDGNHIVMLASDDRRYRLAIEDGEVALYTDEGDHILFKRGKEIYIKSGNKLKADIENDVEINTKRIKAIATESADINTALLTAHATTSATLKSPIVNLQSDAITMTAYTAGVMPLARLVGNMQIEGSTEINLADMRANLRRLIDERFRVLFNAHVHSGCGGSVNSGPPTQTLEFADHATDIMRAK
ncbi:MAG: mu-like prophage Flumu protein gp45 [Nitrospirae bacterium]|nr:MAG: mu-like prophage Flumu protein gp45 [Nitrospirota bacterium]